MKRAVIGLGALAGVVAGVALGVSAQEPGKAAEAATISWRRDLTAAREEARASGKPLFVVFRCET